MKYGAEKQEKQPETKSETVQEEKPVIEETVTVDETAQEETPVSSPKQEEKAVVEEQEPESAPKQEDATVNEEPKEPVQLSKSGLSKTEAIRKINGMTTNESERYALYEAEGITADDLAEFYATYGG